MRYLVPIGAVLIVVAVAIGCTKEGDAPYESVAPSETEEMEGTEDVAPPAPQPVPQPGGAPPPAPSAE